MVVPACLPGSRRGTLPPALRARLGSAIRRKPETRGHVRVCLRVQPFHPDGTPSGPAYVKEYDLATKQLAQFLMALVFNSTQTISDTGGTGRSIANATAVTAPTVLAGTGSTSATVSDTALGTQTETVAGTVTSYSAGTTTGTFTITGTITAGADRAYAEIGCRVTSGGDTFLVCRDVISTTNVSNTGTLAVTYTFTNS